MAAHDSGVHPCALLMGFAVVQRVAAVIGSATRAAEEVMAPEPSSACVSNTVPLGCTFNSTVLPFKQFLAERELRHPKDARPRGLRARRGALRAASARGVLQRQGGAAPRAALAPLCGSLRILPRHVAAFGDGAAQPARNLHEARHACAHGEERKGVHRRRGRPPVLAAAPVGHAVRGGSRSRFAQRRVASPPRAAPRPASRTGR